MDALEPHRCPQCQALVVDRRSPRCTTCQAELPAEWILTPEQIAKLTELDAHARAEHASVLNELDQQDTDDPDRLSVGD